MFPNHKRVGALRVESKTHLSGLRNPETPVSMNEGIYLKL